jgi:hypothetical protein
MYLKMNVKKLVLTWALQLSFAAMSLASPLDNRAKVRDVQADSASEGYRSVTWPDESPSAPSLTEIRLYDHGSKILDLEKSYLSKVISKFKKLSKKQVSPELYYSKAELAEIKETYYDDIQEGIEKTVATPRGNYERSKRSMRAEIWNHLETALIEFEAESKTESRIEANAANSEVLNSQTQRIANLLNELQIPIKSLDISLGISRALALEIERQVVKNYVRLILASDD